MDLEAGLARRSLLVFACGVNMHSLLAIVGWARASRMELAPFVIALVIAELFYKWHSFTLELVGFLATWWVLGFLLDLAVSAIKRGRADKSQA